MANIHDAFTVLWKEGKKVRRLGWGPDTWAELNLRHENWHTALPMIRENGTLRCFKPGKEDYLREDWVLEDGGALPELKGKSTIYKAMICCYAKEVPVRRKLWSPEARIYVTSSFDGVPVLRSVVGGVERDSEYIPAPADMLAEDWEFYHEESIA